MRVELAGWFSLKDRFFEDLKKELDEKEKVREEIIQVSRKLRLSSSKAIMNIHANNIQKSQNFLQDSENLLNQVLSYRETHPELFYLAYDSMQEFVEAYVFTHAVRDLRLPDDLPVSIPQAVLPGLADCIGELRRYVLTLMIRGDDIERVEKIIRLMEELYFRLVEFDYHDKLTGNLKHKLDVVRNVIERTKSDYLIALASSRKT